MLSAEDRKVAEEFKRRLSAEMKVLDFRVYGSRARGDATWESDLDVFIVLESVSPELRERIYDIAWEVGSEMDVVISTFVATPDQLARGPLAAEPIIRNINREGIQV